MKFLVDMTLSPKTSRFLASVGPERALVEMLDFIKARLKK